MSRRLLHRRYDIRGGEGKAACQRCEERRILRLLEMTLRMLGKAGLNVTTNGILLDSFLVDIFAILKAREAFLIYKGKTLEPSGMNRRDEI